MAKTKFDWIGTFKSYWPAALGISVVAAGGTFGICGVQQWRALTKAENQLNKGWAALAAETIDPHKRGMTRTQKGCTIMIASYFQAHRTEQLEWASQACLEAGHNLPESYVGLAAAREFQGRDADALQILNSVTGTFDKSPDIYFRMAQILRRAKRDGEAVIAYQRAVERAPQAAQLAMDALEYFAGINKWTEAAQMADKIKDVQTDNPEVKLVIARALLRGGNKASASAVVDSARQLMDKKPDIKKALEQNYGDVLNGGQVAQGTNSPASAPQMGAPNAQNGMMVPQSPGAPMPGMVPGQRAPAAGTPPPAGWKPGDRTF